MSSITPSAANRPRLLKLSSRSQRHLLQSLNGSRSASRYSRHSYAPPRDNYTPPRHNYIPREQPLQYVNVAGRQAFEERKSWWSRRSRWLQWPLYAYAAYYTGLAVYWATHREEVPITGRRQFESAVFEPLVGKPQDIETPHQIFADSDVKDALLAADDSRVTKAKAILKRVLMAAGLDQQKWPLFIVENDGCNGAVNPLGFVLLATGLFAAAESDDELAAFLSYEIAKILTRHQNAVSSAFWINTAIQKPIWPFRGVWGSLVQSVPTLNTHLGTKRDVDFGQDAHDIGMLLIAEAGFDPAAMVSLRRKQFILDARKGGLMIGGPDWYYRASASAVLHPLYGPIGDIAARVPIVKYLTEKGPMPKGLNSREAHDLEAYKGRWQEFVKDNAVKAAFKHG
ncbi:MAG: hypothetical protein Q9174_006266 [Haloplaca sp. 1 TL-2023]